MWSLSFGLTFLALAIGTARGIETRHQYAWPMEVPSPPRSVETDQLPADWRDLDAAKMGTERAKKKNNVLSRSTIGPDSVPGNQSILLFEVTNYPM